MTLDRIPKRLGCVKAGTVHKLSTRPEFADVIVRPLHQVDIDGYSASMAKAEMALTADFLTTKAN